MCFISDLIDEIEETFQKQKDEKNFNIELIYLSVI